MKSLSIYDMEKASKVDFKGFRSSKSPTVLSVQISLTPKVNFPHDVMYAGIT